MSGHKKWCERQHQPADVDEFCSFCGERIKAEPETYEYRVVSVDLGGTQTATVAFSSRDYAERMWHAANKRTYVARCWIERRPLNDWEVCSSETGQELMALAPTVRETKPTGEPS